MGFLGVLIACAAFIALLPYICCFVKRLIFRSKIKKTCIKKGYKLHTTHVFWYLGSKYSKKCDLYIETDNDVFSVKLFGMPNQRAVLVLKENGEFFIRRFFLMIYYISILLWPINSKAKKLPSYDFKYACKDEWQNKVFNKILLVNPVGMQFRYVSNKGVETMVQNGEYVNDLKVISLSEFLKTI